jgi:hypothetical protein
MTPTPLGGLARRTPGSPARSATTALARIPPSRAGGQEVAASFPEAAPTAPVPTDLAPTAATHHRGDTRTTAEAKA